MNTAIITGSGKGIGFETAIRFSELGYKVICISRNIQKLKALDNPNIIPYGWDITDFKNYDNPLSFIKSHCKKIDVLINNAGLLIKDDFENTQFEDLVQTFNVNLFAPYKLTQMLLPLMDKTGHIVNISSMGGVRGSIKFSELSAYSISKGALNTMTEIIAESLKNTNIRCNALALGAVKTEMLNEAFPDYTAPIDAHEMGKYIVDFAIHSKKFIHGKIIEVSCSNP